MTSTLDDARGELLALADEIERAAALRTVGRAARQLPVGSPKLIVAALRAAPPSLVSPPSEAGREMLEAFQRIQGYSNNPGLVYTICSKMIDRLSPDQGTVAVASADRGCP